MRPFLLRSNLVSRPIVKEGRRAIVNMGFASHGNNYFTTAAVTKRMIPQLGCVTAANYNPLVRLPRVTTSQTRRSMVVVTKTKAAGPTIVANDDDVTIESSISTTQSASTSNIDTTSGNVQQQQQQQGDDNNLIITDSCWKQILRLAARKNLEPSEMFLRVYVDAGGCSGFEYKFEVETTGESALEDDDIVWQGPDGARVVVDESSLAFIRGATLDYVVEMIKSAFTIHDNPQSESACGCGSSFAVKNFSTNPALD